MSELLVLALLFGVGIVAGIFYLAWLIVRKIFKFIFVTIIGTVLKALYDLALEPIVDFFDRIAEEREDKRWVRMKILTMLSSEEDTIIDDVAMKRLGTEKVQAYAKQFLQKLCADGRIVQVHAEHPYIGTCYAPAGPGFSKNGSPYRALPYRRPVS